MPNFRNKIIIILSFVSSKRIETSLFDTQFWWNRAERMDGQTAKTADGQADGYLGIFINLDKRISKKKIKEIPNPKYAEQPLLVLRPRPKQFVHLLGFITELTKTNFHSRGFP